MAFKFRRNGSRNDPEGMLPEFNGTESMTPKSSVGICRRSIWASSTNNKQCPFFLHHHHRPRRPPTSPPLHRHQWPPSRTSVTHDHDSEDDVATTRHQANERQPQRSGWKVPRRCGRRGYQTTNDDDVVVRRFR